MKWAAAAPLLAQVSLQEAMGTGWAQVAKNSTDNIFTRIGIKPLINARGTWTYLSASLELPEVRAAQEQASQHFVNIFDLQVAVGKRLAELTGAESGMITSGAAGAMAAGTAGCIAGTDPDRIWQLPNTDGMKNEVIMVGGRSVFDSAIRLTGARLVLVDSADHIANAVTKNTAMVYTTSPNEPLAKEIAASKAHNIPIMMDAADGIPPVDKMQLFAKMGCDLYTFSGGKGLCGPQSSGILLGRKDLIDAALANSSPWEGAVCRPMKVGKEEIMGCLAAVEVWLKMDVGRLNRGWTDQMQRIATLVDTIPGVETKILSPETDQCPTLSITWDQQAWGYTIDDCARQLLEGTPAIAVMSAENPSEVLERKPRPKRQPKKSDTLQIVSMTLRPGEEIIIGQRLRQLLSQARKNSAA